MKYVLLLFIALNLYAQVYYAKVEPVRSYYVKSALSAKVIFVNEGIEGDYSSGELVIQLDDKLDKINLQNSKKKMEILNTNIKLTKKSLKNLELALEIEEKNYQKINNLKTKSQFEKDAKLLNLINLKNSYIQTKLNLETLKLQKVDLDLKIKNLQDIIKKKNIKVKKGLYIYKIYPNIDDFVTAGAKLLDLHDLSKAKLTIFVSSEDIVDIEKKTIYIDQKPTKYKIAKLWRVADTKNISSYKVEIIIDKPDIFSKLVKIEFK